uniref:Uncharacterized protein n=1 Tax=Parascaris equorum TaxID=6256 RepID=A0A914R3K0_PAREQ
LQFLESLHNEGGGFHGGGHTSEKTQSNVPVPTGNELLLEGISTQPIYIFSDTLSFPIRYWKIMFDANPEEPDKGPYPIGYCVVGPMCVGTGCAHWFQMIRKTGLPVCMWHRMTKG